MKTKWVACSLCEATKNKYCKECRGSGVVPQSVDIELLYGEPKETCSQEVKSK